MSDFLGRLAARAVGQSAPVSPRLPSRFEPAGPPFAAMEAPDAAGAVGAVGAARGAAAAAGAAKIFPWEDEAAERARSADSTGHPPVDPAGTRREAPDLASRLSSVLPPFAELAETSAEAGGWASGGLDGGPGGVGQGRFPAGPEPGFAAAAESAPAPWPAAPTSASDRPPGAVLAAAPVARSASTRSPAPAPGFVAARLSAAPDASGAAQLAAPAWFAASPPPPAAADALGSEKVESFSATAGAGRVPGAPEPSAGGARRAALSPRGLATLAAGDDDAVVPGAAPDGGSRSSRRLDSAAAAPAAAMPGLGAVSGARRQVVPRSTFAPGDAGGGAPAPAAEPIVRVTIGRIEVRAAAAPAPTPAPPARPGGPRLTLEEYLRRRGEGRT